MNNAKDLAEVAAAAVTMTGAVGAAIWWLIWPRIRDAIREVARGVDRLEQQTASDDPDTLSRHARVAAAGVSEIPELREQVTAIGAKLTDYDDWKRRIENRVGKVEEVTMALLSRDLWSRIHEDADPDQN